MLLGAEVKESRMKLTPAILAALKKVDAAHAEFFAVLDREARKRPSRTKNAKPSEKR